MKIEPKEIRVRELFEGYEDKAEAGVVAYGGKLDVRPPYQREFIYKDKQRDAVIDTVRRDYPLNVMYWAVREDGRFEVIDGQQRTLSICQYLKGDFSIKGLAFHNLQDDQQQQIVGYKLMVYLCSGTDSEKLEWFKTINIAGEELSNQELRNAVYAGSWLADAKRWFSRSGCPAYQIGEKYVNASIIRQGLLEKALEWISDDKIEDYMSRHQHDADAQELWQYFQEVVAWVKRIFPEHRNIMKGLDWGSFYNDHKDDKLNAAKLEDQIVELIDDDEVDSKRGIYEYLLTGNEKTLSLRAFDQKTQVKIYEKQKGICPVCKKQYDIGAMEADHIVPWSKGGKTVPENCQMLCKLDNRTKSGK
jgi:hypothetical protein